MAPLCVRARDLRGPGARPRSAGCVLGAPSQFLDSVMFLSHCLDIVHEHCSGTLFTNTVHKTFSKKIINEIK